MIIRKILSLLFLGLAVTSAASEKQTDGFEYEDMEALSRKWRISGTGFKEPVKIRLNEKEALKGKRCLELILPPSTKYGARLTLDVNPDVKAEDIAQIRLGLRVDRPELTGRCGTYWSDEGFKNYSVCYWNIRNEKDWQKIYISKRSFGTERGNPVWSAGSLMRISFWISANQPENRILLDEIEWDIKEEKAPLLLNREWWDYPGVQ